MGNPTVKKPTLKIFFQHVSIMREAQKTVSLTGGRSHKANLVAQTWQNTVDNDIRLLKDATTK